MTPMLIESACIQNWMQALLREPLITGSVKLIARFHFGM